MQKLPIIAMILLGALACGPGEGEGEGEYIVVAGDWTEDWSCVQSCTGLALAAAKEFQVRRFEQAHELGLQAAKEDPFSDEIRMAVGTWQKYVAR